jgi:glycine dehydrogenase
VIGAASRQAPIEAIGPRSIARTEAMSLTAPVSEAQALAELRCIAAKNHVLKRFIGQGYHGRHMPRVILRNILRTRPGAPRIRRTRPRSRKAGSRRW